MTESIKQMMQTLGQQAKEASRALARAATKDKNAAHTSKLKRQKLAKVMDDHSKIPSFS